MSQAIANFSLFSPNVIGKNQKCAIPVFSKPIHGGGRFSYGKNRIKAMAGDARDNLDHLQRAAKLQQQQQQQAQPRKRAAPAPPIGLWDRFPTARTVQQMMETMERMMEDPLAYSGGYTTPLPREAGVYGRGRTPWEIKEGESDYKMRFDMPGMTKEDVKVWVEDKMLVVKAEKAAKKTENGAVVEENGEEWSAKSYGRYSSRIALPENIQFEEIKAEVKDGVLYITIPKASITSKILDINVS
ncbi:hypothetical protein C1H46_027438 [Malus baccata]|uniref:SHSP domain-containing protein n=1 Tax=Malus baccata TaxID=106549 RepID=A0A540LKJ2_MALBA|nr:hypothetical protein C1H46_027438 [Malus baccata]